METIQAIRSRRSIRKYQPKPVPHEVIEQIVADAAYAPSWKNTQIARYVLVEDRATIDKMAEEMVLDFKLNEKTLKNCPAVMVLTYVTGRSGYERDGSFSTPKEAGFEMFDAGVAAQTFWSCRVGARRRHGHHGLLRRREDHETLEPAGESEGRLCYRSWLSR